jgi:hypothetical protein
VFLDGIVLTDSMCNLPGRQHAFHAEVELLKQEGWLGVTSASVYTYMPCLASSTPSTVGLLELSYTMTTNFCKIFKSSSSTVGEYWPSLLKIPEAVSHTS